MAVWLQVKNEKKKQFFLQQLRREGAFKICIFFTVASKQILCKLFFFLYIIISGKFTTCTPKQSTTSTIN